MAKRARAHRRPGVSRTPQTATQMYLDIAEIRDDVVILRDNSYRSVLMCSSINFDLKAEEEKNAIIIGYQSFINSLNFPLQIMIRSRRINLDSYIGKLEEYEKAQTHELIRLQTGDYIEFIRRLIEVVNIMQKTFYVVVPFYPTGLSPEASQGIANVFRRKPKNVQAKGFEESKTQLKQRAGLVAQGLGTLGVRAAELKTQELIELYYATYNPEVEKAQRLADAAELTGPAVLSGGNPPDTGPAPLIRPEDDV